MSVFVEDRHGGTGRGGMGGEVAVWAQQGAEHQGGDGLEVVSLYFCLGLCQAWLSGRSHFASKLIHGPCVPELPEQHSVNNYALQGPLIRFQG